MNGTIWKFDDKRGIEVGRSDFRIQLVVINDHWPFPSEPIWVDASLCKREREPTEVWRQNNEFDHVFIKNGEAPL
jgi:hypothetical protein